MFVIEIVVEKFGERHILKRRLDHFLLRKVFRSVPPYGLHLQAAAYANGTAVRAEDLGHLAQQEPGAAPHVDGMRASLQGKRITRVVPLIGNCWRAATALERACRLLVEPDRRGSATEQLRVHGPGQRPTSVALGVSQASNSTGLKFNDISALIAAYQPGYQFAHQRQVADQHGIFVPTRKRADHGVGRITRGKANRGFLDDTSGPQCLGID